MTRKLTFLILALFALIAGPGWGQTKTDYTELFTVTSDDVVTNSGYTAYTTTVGNRAWIITFGGNNKSVGTNKDNRKNCKLSSYQKYAVSPVTTSDIASAFVSTTSIADVSKISYTFGGGSNQANTNVYLIYSSDGNTFSQISLTSGTQGAAISSGTEYEFAICSGYFGLLFKATNSSGAWRIDDVNITFYEASAPSTDPAINAEDVNLAYDATSGEIPYTITNPVEGQSLVAALTTNDCDWISNVDVDATNRKVTFATTANQTFNSRTATITLTYGEVTKDVTVTQDGMPAPVINLDNSTVNLTYNETTTTIGFSITNPVDNTRLDLFTQCDWIDGFVINANDFQFTAAVNNSSSSRTAVITVSYQGAESKTVTVSQAVDPSQVVIYEKFTGNLVEGDYVIYYDGKAMKNTVTSNRLDYSEVSPENNVITNPDAAIVWHIAPSGDYWTIFNAAVAKYAAGNGTKSQATLLTDGTDNGSLWTVSRTETHDFTNKKNTLSSVNATLRNNGTYGFACYATGTGGALTLYKKAVGGTKYDIFIDEDIENGTITSSKAKAYKDDLVTLTINPNEGYELAELYVYEGDNNEVDIEQADATHYTFIMPGDYVTVMAAFQTITYKHYTLVTDDSQLVEGRKYLIAGYRTQNFFIMGEQNDNNRQSVSASQTNNMITMESSATVYEFTLGVENNHWTLYDPQYNNNEGGYLYAASSSSNLLKSQKQNNANGEWAITIGEDGEAEIIAQGANTHNILQKNGSSNLFSCYSTTQNPVYLYIKGEIEEEEGKYTVFGYVKKDNFAITSDKMLTIAAGATLEVTTLTNNGDEDNLLIEDGGQLICNNAVKATVQKAIAGHSGEDATGGWNFIASPIDGGSAVSTVQTTESAYDLYRFNQAAVKEWENVKDDHTDFTTLANGQGYLYANAANTTLEFAGTLYNGNGEINLTFADKDNLDNTPYWQGWNLVGNPFTFKAYPSLPYYAMENDGTAISAETSEAAINPCTAVFVKASATGQSVTFSKDAPAKAGSLQISLAQANTKNASRIDNAIVSFGEGQQLEKLYMFGDGSSLYIPQGDKEYSVVSAETEGSLPLCFKTSKNGNYTITVNTENLDAEYLHLIDNMTGMDVDLLTTDSYTFEAKDTDYTSRFKLVFNVKDEASASSANDFAYMSDGNLVISNIEGQATLQIIDMMGRVLSTETVSGNYCKALNLKAGVYVLNLNGMTQKIVVE